MTDPMIWAGVSAAGLAGLTVVTIATLKGWRDWIALQRLGLERRLPATQPPCGQPAARIELADLKERVRKLEAIAAGVDL